MDHRKFQMFVWGMALLLVCATNALAQTNEEPQQDPKKVTVTVDSVKIIAPRENATQTQGATFRFVTTEMGFDSKIITGAPFTADALTEFTQVLSTGQRIHQKFTSTIYRDSDGRTRREQRIDFMIGPFGSAGQTKRMIIINDPMAHINYVLDPENHTATKRVIEAQSQEKKIVAQSIVIRNGSDGTEQKTLQSSGSAVTAAISGSVAGGINGKVLAGEEVSGIIAQFAPSDVRKEPLGMQVIEGVQAEGTRIVETIPAGAIGNDSPIEIITENWVSPELGITVRTVHNDPRSGENLYQLTNIRRGDPPASLFQVPSDYTITEEPSSGNVIFQIKK